MYNICRVEVEELCVPPDAKQGPGEVDPGAAQWEGEGTPLLRGQGPDSVGEESSQEFEDIFVSCRHHGQLQ